MAKKLSVSFHYPKPSKLLQGIKKIPWVLGRDAFLLILLFSLVSVLLGEFLFYQYIFLTKVEAPKTFAAPIRFQENVYHSVLDTWKAREAIFDNSTPENYGNPFQTQ